MRAMRIKAVLGIICGVLTILFGAGLLAAASYLISLSSLMVNIGALTLPIVAVRFFGIGRAVLRYGERYLTHAATFATASRVRTRLYTAMEGMAIAGNRMYRTHSAKALVFDADIISEWYVRVLTPTVVCVVTVLVCCAVLACISVEVAVVFGIGAILLGIILPYGSRCILSRAIGEVDTAKEALSSSLTELVDGLVDARLSGAESALYRRELAEIASAHRVEERLAVREAVLSGISEIVAQAIVWLVLVGSIGAVANGSLPGVWLASLVLGVSACMEAFLPLVGASRYDAVVSRARERMRAVTDVAKISCGTREATHTDAIVLDKVTYTAGSRTILSEVTLTVHRGEHIAIVGASGSGKTTLTRLLYGDILPTGGQVTFDGVATHEMRQGAVADICGSIGQEVDIFGGTVEDNVRLARPTATDGVLSSVWQEVCLSDLSPTRELHALGRELSGGQRQRIAIARYLLVANRELAIWDEPLVGLSADMASDLHRRLLDTRAGRTLILVTHRLDALADFDRILVMEGGRIIEAGTEEELLRQGGRYAQMKRLQRGEVDRVDEIDELDDALQSG